MGRVDGFFFVGGGGDGVWTEVLLVGGHADVWKGREVLRCTITMLQKSSEAVVL